MFSSTPTRFTHTLAAIAVAGALSVSGMAPAEAAWHGGGGFGGYHGGYGGWHGGYGGYRGGWGWHGGWGWGGAALLGLGVGAAVAGAYAPYYYPPPYYGYAPPPAPYYAPPPSGYAQPPAAYAQPPAGYAPPQGYYPQQP